MIASHAANGESPVNYGGQIPGMDGAAAFALTMADPSRIPILISVPHAGRAYSGDLLTALRHPEAAALKLEDRYVDLIARDLAAATGAASLVAYAPRAMIDLNRADDDIDWEMIANGQPGPRLEGKLGRRARSGLGLIPRRVSGLGELWSGMLAPHDLEQRIAQVHSPYHRILEQALGQLRDRWGAALLIDLHSMPPLGRDGAYPPAQFVVGDRFGISCDGRFVATAFSHLRQCGKNAAHNRPYSGGYVLERHAAPRRNVHAFQLEIDRSCYLDARLAEPGPGYAETVDLLIGLVRQLADDVAAVGAQSSALNPVENWPEAAE